MTREDAVNIAFSVAREESWPWLEPIRASRSRRGLFGPYVWNVWSHDGYRGRNVRVEIMDVSGEVLFKGYIGR
jgi:hypothetical protein